MTTSWTAPFIDTTYKGPCTTSSLVDPERRRNVADVSELMPASLAFVVNAADVVACVGSDDVGGPWLFRGPGGRWWPETVLKGCPRRTRDFCSALRKSCTIWRGRTSSARTSITLTDRRRRYFPLCRCLLALLVFGTFGADYSGLRLGVRGYVVEPKRRDNVEARFLPTKSVQSGPDA